LSYLIAFLNILALDKKFQNIHKRCQRPINLPIILLQFLKSILQKLADLPKKQKLFKINILQ